MDKQVLSSIRTDYTQNELDESSIDHNPVQQFENWLDQALNAQVMEPNAMSLSTVNEDGKPSSRIVLLKGIDEGGLVFFTNYESKKGNAMQEKPFVSVLFFWPELQRQVRIEGKVSKISEEDSIAYFHSRPRGSQLSAMVSPQSKKILDRQFLEDESEKLTEYYSQCELLPKPLNWGGYRITPTLFEFWQGRGNRLHDRIQFDLNKSGDWEISRLAP